MIDEQDERKGKGTQRLFQGEDADDYDQSEEDNESEEDENE